jgi:hypothetical protein
MVVEDCRAFAVEKNSVAPQVEVVAEEGLQATLVVPYVEFVLMEVLKNALQVGGRGRAVREGGRRGGGVEGGGRERGEAGKAAGEGVRQAKGHHRWVEGAPGASPGHGVLSC